MTAAKTAEEKAKETADQQVKDQEEIDGNRKVLEAKEKALEEKIALFDSRIESDMAALAAERRRTADLFEAFEVSQQGVAEIGLRGKGIERVTPHMTEAQMELEAFMNEEVAVTVAKSGNKEENPVALPSVNGVNQPMPLGVKIRVRRKYIEALAHSRVDIILQAEDRPGFQVEGANVQSAVALTHVFNVHNDSEKGQEWLTRLLAEPT